MTSISQPVLVAQPVLCELVHLTRGRVRIRIPRLFHDLLYREVLLNLVQLLEGITSARINPLARSLVVHYSPQLSASEITAQLFSTVQQAAQRPVSIGKLATSRSIGQSIGQPMNQAIGQLAVISEAANLRGIGWMLLATGGFAGMQASIQLISGTIHPFQIAFFSHLIGIGILAPWIAKTTVLQTEQMPLHLLRAIIDVGATLLLFSGISLLSLAEANAIGFTAPLFATIGAVIFLGEQMQTHTWIALLLGIIGMLVILRPGIEIISVGAILMLAGAATLGGVLLIIKILSQRDSNLTINAYTVLLLTPMLLIPALLVWQTPTLIDLAWLTLVSALMVGGHMAMTQAFAEADMTVVLPVEFAQLLWAGGLGYLLFAETPDLWTLLGGLLIFLGATYTAAMENYRQPEQA